jgi:hypothetical protein
MYLRRDGVAEMHAANTFAQNEIGKVSCIASELRRRSSLPAVSKWIILFINLIARWGIYNPSALFTNTLISTSRIIKVGM